MSQYNSHLTTEQMSAFLDQQLSAQEQSTSQTHLNTCELCQQQLAELQQTVLLLHALPRASLPRSFVLPIESTIQSEAVAGEEDATPKIARQAHNRILVLPSYVRTTMRIASTLVAVLGLFFILSGLLAMVSGTSHVSTSLEISTKARVANSSSDTHQPQPLAGAAVVPSSNTSQPQLFAGGAAAPSPNVHQSPLPSGRAANTQNLGLSPNTSQPQPPMSPITPFFDLGTPEGHLSIGLLLLIAGIVSVTLFTRLGKQGQQEQSQ